MLVYSFVIAAGKQPRLNEAHKLIHQAYVKITEAQKAKDLLVEAEKEVKLAKEAAK